MSGIVKPLTIATLVLVASLITLPASSAVQAGGCGCVTCCECPPPPPPPVKTILCVVDPCTGCTYEVCVMVPAECCGEVPCMTWRPGIFGRKVLTYTWPCCGHCVDVVITRHGRTIVRD